MSLEIAAVCDKYAVVVSDGLEWNGDKIIREDAQKQIQLGPAIVITAGGYSSEMDELFTACEFAYKTAIACHADPAPIVKHTFSSVFEGKPFPGFGETCLVGLLAIKEPSGFSIIRQHSGGKPEVYRVGPGDAPQWAFCGPGTRSELFFHALLHYAVGIPLREGAQPARVIANLRKLYEAAASFEEPPKLNASLTVTILGDVEAGTPCEPDKDLVAQIEGLAAKAREAYSRATNLPAVAQPEGARANNAINNNGEYSNDPAQTLTLAEAVYGTVTISTNGGNVEIYAKCNVVNSSGATEVIQAGLRRDSLTGAVLDSSTVTVNATINKSTLFLSAIDPTPSASQSYVLTLFCGSTPSTVSNIRIIAANRKK